jgi:hypothetical protein
MPITSAHEPGAPSLQFRCPRAEAVFPAEEVRLANETPAVMLWDEHGGTYVLRVEDLKVMDSLRPGAESGIRLEVALPAAETLVAGVESFAGQHRLPLAAGPATPELALRPILAACHVPGKNLFVYCEEAQLQVRPGAGSTLEFAVTGTFKARRVPCREPDVVIHLTGPEMSGLLSYLLSLARM